jgi:7-carboxy-7-deazaguanine synthase
MTKPTPSPDLMINELFHSIQGESTWAGCPCLFVRLTGCHLRCRYCDTAYAFHEGRRMSIGQIIEQLGKLGPTTRLVQITGGEPLLQPNVQRLISRLADAGYTVLIETSGACDISTCDRRAIRIMDIKTPGSGEADRNLWSNLDHLSADDEVKFVICDRADYHWSRKVVLDHELYRRVKAVLMSPCHAMPGGGELAGAAGLSRRDLAEWILADPQLAGRVRLQGQLHKQIWPADMRGV